jgi:hypothetical protein
MGFGLSTPLCLWQSRHFLPNVRVIPLSAFSRQGRPYPDMTRTFCLAYREGELGTLPSDVRDLVRVSVRRLSTEIGASLQLPKGILWTPTEAL